MKNRLNGMKDKSKIKKSKKGFLSVCAAMVLLTGVTVQAEIPQYSLEEFPVIDGSLACVPLITRLIQDSTGCTESEAEDFDFSNTNPSYLNLAKGQRDIILSYEASAETKEELENGTWTNYDVPEDEEGRTVKYSDADLEMTEIGRDALVFLVNAENPVDSLTLEQAKRIFTGEITNWSEVGGDDAEIISFIRPENSGSQTMMRLLLVGDAQMPEKQTISVPTMEGMIDQIKNYDNAKDSIGYSVYYYTDKMMADPKIKVLEIDGVLPTNETIKSGEYSLINPFYCGTSKYSSDKALALRDWLVEEEGQQLLEECGYVGIK